MGWDSFKDKAAKLSTSFYFKRQFQKVGERIRTQYQVWEKPKVEGPGFVGDYKVMVINYPDDFLKGSPWDMFYRILTVGVKRRNANKQKEVFDNYVKREADKKEARHKKIDSDTRAFFRQERRAFAGMADEHGISASSLKSGLRGMTDEEAKKEISRFP